MGNVVMSKLSRPFRTFNVEHRAEKILRREKPIAAPSYPSAEKQKKIVDELYPDFMENHLKKDSKLDDRLRKVFVSSSIQHENKEGESGDKVMPERRHTDPEFDFGFWEPKAPEEGRALFRDVLQFMADNMTDPEKYSKQNIALKYKLNLKDVENIIEYYRIFKVVIPKKGGVENLRVDDSNLKGTIADK